MQSKKNTWFKKKNIVQQKCFLMFIFIFYHLKKGKYISILWSAYSVIHIIYCIIQAANHHMNSIHIDSDSNNFMIFISKI